MTFFLYTKQSIVHLLLYIYSVFTDSNLPRVHVYAFSTADDPILDIVERYDNLFKNGNCVFPIAILCFSRQKHWRNLLAYFFFFLICFHFYFIFYFWFILIFHFFCRFSFLFLFSVIFILFLFLFLTLHFCLFGISFYWKPEKYYRYWNQFLLYRYNCYNCCCSQYHNHRHCFILIII